MIRICYNDNMMERDKFRELCNRVRTEGPITVEIDPQRAALMRYRFYRWRTLCRLRGDQSFDDISVEKVAEGMVFSVSTPDDIEEALSEVLNGERS